VEFGKIEIFEGPVISPSSSPATFPEGDGFALKEVLRQKKVCSRGLQLLSGSVAPEQPQPSPLPKLDLADPGRPKFRYGSLRGTTNLAARFKNSPSTDEPKESEVEITGMRWGSLRNSTNLADRFKPSPPPPPPDVETIEDLLNDGNSSTSSTESLPRISTPSSTGQRSPRIPLPVEDRPLVKLSNVESSQSGDLGTTTQELRILNMSG
jgi:hypothetical protein